MFSLAGKKMVVIGGSRGIGRQIVESGLREGAHVLAVARHPAPLRKLAGECPYVQILALDATDESAPNQVFAALAPDILVLGGGAVPAAGPLHQQSWQEFSVNWESDVKIAFQFCKSALSSPLPPGTTIIVISSGAALAGSPNTGGYAGAKRTQLFIANYCQKESDRLRLGLQFVSLAPRIVPEAGVGRSTVAGYARYLGISEADFLNSLSLPPSASDVANAVMRVAKEPLLSKGKVFAVSAAGLESLP